MKNIMVSGGFDPVHVGHIQMIQEAAQSPSTTFRTDGADGTALRDVGAKSFRILV